MTNLISRRRVLAGAMATGIAGATWSLHTEPATAAGSATADTYGSAITPDANHGSEVELLVQDPKGTARRIAYLKFDLPTETSKYVTLRLEGAHQSEWAAQIQIYAVPDAAWQESTLTWRNRPAHDESPLATGLVSGLSNNTYEWDVTAAVEAARAAAKSVVSLAVVSASAQTKPVSFVSRSGRGTRPTLLTAAARIDPRVVVQSKAKTADAYRPYLANTVDTISGFTPDAVKYPIGKYGGRSDVQLSATGFFRVAQIRHSKLGFGWSLIDPQGYAFYAVGVASLARFNKGNADDEDSYRRKYGNDDSRWANESVQFVRGLSFNSSGGFSDDEVVRQSAIRLPYTPVLAVMNDFAAQIGVGDPGYGNSKYLASSMPAWHPDFPDFAESYLADKLTPRRDDPWLLGWFTDNELPVSTGALENLLTGKNNGDDPRLVHSREQAKTWITKRRGTEVDFSNPGITDTEAGAWHGFAFDRYFEVVAPIVRRIDPNHLLLGSRLHSRAPRDPDIVAAVGRHVDVLSVNYYERWDARSGELDMWAKQAPNSPALITEFYVKGEDTGFASAQQDLGAGWIVPNQADRGTFYQNMTLGMLAHPHLIGWHDFKFKDNFGDSNKGLLAHDYAEYREFTASVGELNRNAYALRAHLRALPSVPNRRR